MRKEGRVANMRARQRERGEKVFGRNKQQRKDERKGTLVVSAHHCILHGCLAQVSVVFIMFGGASFWTKVIPNKALRTREYYRV